MYIDIGGTYLRFAKLKNGTFYILKKERHNKTNKIKLKKHLEEIINYRKTKGISYAGIILKETKKSKIIYLPNLRIRLRISKKIISENDANLIALAHKKIGKIVVVLVIGTGIGLGVWHKDKLLDGNFGEIGHIKIKNKELETLILSKLKKTNFENLNRKEKEQFFKSIAELIENLFYVFFFDELVLHGAIGKIIFENRKNRIFKKTFINIKQKFNKSIKVALSKESDVFKGLKILEKTKKN
ncbi:MAG: ROK family protein [Candidatus Woesearchaeota archaeon]